MSEIKHLFEFVDGNFETETGELICVGNKKYGSVTLCFKGPMHISFANIKLHSNPLLREADAVFDDAITLGNEIARRWNSAEVKK
jgi:hypothetical protein